jgi:hypothetical protein
LHGKKSAFLHDVGDARELHAYCGAAGDVDHERTRKVSDPF